MKKYKVEMVWPVYVTITVEAETEEEALEAAQDEAYMDSYCGNGGLGDKIVGVNDSHISIYPGEMELEGTFEFETSVEEVDEPE